MTEGAPTQAEMRAGFGHESPRMAKEEWLTPPYLIHRLGEFDLDPCSPAVRPWDTARVHFTYKDDGLTRPWTGRVWLNPPFGIHAKAWLARMAEHNNGVALLAARTETKAWTEYVWSKATAICFVTGRIAFHHADGRKAGATLGAPTALIAYGPYNAAALEDAKLGPVVRWQR